MTGRLAAAALVLLVGCSTPPGRPVVSGEIDAAEVGRLIQAHNRRVAMLAHLSARGVLELRWIDSDGHEHFEPQVDAHLWLSLPGRAALHADKLGEDMFWVGSDGTRSWLFDLTSDETRLHVWPPGAAPPPGAELFGRIGPMVLVDLIGLCPLPSGEGRAALGVTRNETGTAWWVEAEGRGGRLRVLLDLSTGFPTRVEILDAAGDVMLSSTLRRSRSIRMSGMARAAWPRIPTLIDIADPGDEISLKLALSGDMSVDVPEQVFDLDSLIAHLRPDIVDRRE